MSNCIAKTLALLEALAPFTPARADRIFESWVLPRGFSTPASENTLLPSDPDHYSGLNSMPTSTNLDDISSP